MEDSGGKKDLIIFVQDRMEDSRRRGEDGVDVDENVLEGVDKGKEKESDDVTPIQRNKDSLLLNLPLELLDQIVSQLNPSSLTVLLRTCKTLRQRALVDSLWQKHIQSSLPGMALKSPSPCTTYYDLFASHAPHWFLTRNILWFSDYRYTGKLIIIRYIPSRGSIEGYQIVASRNPEPIEVWEQNPLVQIHNFNPSVHVHTNLPVLRLNATPSMNLADLISPIGSGDLTPRIGRRWDVETYMPFHNRSHQINSSTFLLTRSVPQRPNMTLLWPPPSIPALNNERVRNASQENFAGLGHKPRFLSEVCESAFRIRLWAGGGSAVRASIGLQTMLGGSVETFAALDRKLWTPTRDKIFRGVWVGDYSSHGPEFLLVKQPDDEVPLDESSVSRMEDESEPDWRKRVNDKRIYRGIIEAVKLTGDPYVPRGEQSWVADDIGDAGLIRIAEEEKFRGARIVKSKGHVAGRNFGNPEHIDSELFLISPDLIAHYWIPFDHISYYKRVNIDELLQSPGES